jgi:hypothetical protein
MFGGGSYGGGYGGMRMPGFGGGGYGGGYGMQSIYQPQPNYFGGYQQQNPFGSGMSSIYGNYFGNNMGTSQIPYGGMRPAQAPPSAQAPTQAPPPPPPPPPPQRNQEPLDPVENVPDAQPIPVNPVPKPDRGTPSVGNQNFFGGGTSRENFEQQYEDWKNENRTWFSEGRKQLEDWANQNPDADWREVRRVEEQLRKKYGAEKNYKGDPWNTVYPF